MKNTWHIAAVGICSLVAIIALGLEEIGHAALTSNNLSDAQAASPATLNLTVNCNNGHTISDALARGRDAGELEIQFSGGCQERIRIQRDRVTLRGEGADAVLSGFIDVEGASEITLRDFSIRGGGIVPPSRLLGAVNVTQGAAANIIGLRIENFPGRGVRVLGATADLQNVTVERSTIGFEFWNAQVNLAGTLVGNDNAVGMLLFASGVLAQADLSFSGNTDLGFVVQLSSSFSHVRGRLNVRGSQIGVLLSANGTYGFGSFVDIRDTIAYGLVVEDLSSFTAFRGAPGGGPSVTVTGNPVGISVTRGATLDLIAPTIVTANGVGLEVDEGLAKLEGVTISDNSAGDMKLGFSARATFIEEGNVLGSPLQCHETALARGSIGCGAPLTAAAAASSSRPGQEVEPRELLSRILE